MEKEKPTLALYGIQDREAYPFPFYVHDHNLTMAEHGQVLSFLQQKRNEIAGVVHADGTARIQTVFDRQENPFLYDLLSCLDRDFGVKALINTSFNQQNEPIVHTLQDAIRSAGNMKLDALVLNGHVQPLKGNPDVRMS
jgi:predicted NodU family carbamoyl transferase